MNFSPKEFMRQLGKISREKVLQVAFEVGGEKYKNKIKKELSQMKIIVR